MNTLNKVENLDELLRICWLEDVLQDNNEAAVFSIATPEISEIKKNEMTNRLYAFSQQLSFGELLTKSLEGENEASIVQKTEISEAMLDELKADKLAVNNVPLMLLKNLLKELHISFVHAQAAILKSFELLRNTVSSIHEPAMARPIFRKGEMDGSSEPFKRVPNKDLFENEESLNKYLKRLEKLMQ